MEKIYLANKIFTGDDWVNEQSSIITEGGVITCIKPGTAPGQDTINLNEKIIVPAFIDLQIYGANKKLFAVYPTVDALTDLYDYCVQGGAVLFQPTVATNRLEVFYKCIDAVREYWVQKGKGVIGLHLEGPWINPEKRGAHMKELIHPPTMQEAKALLEYGKGVISMITLAPEVCSPEIINLIQSHGIIVSAGHSDIGYKGAMESFNNGISVITHLYNAMSPLQHRNPGLVGAAFLHPNVKASIIPDGHHVDFAAVRIAVELMKERLFVITDAVTETVDGEYKHQLCGEKYEANGILSGSALTIHKAFTNLVKETGVPIEQACKMCSLTPAKVMGLDKFYGKIAPGYTAQFLVLDKGLSLLDVVGL